MFSGVPAVCESGGTIKTGNVTDIISSLSQLKEVSTLPLSSSNIYTLIHFKSVRKLHIAILAWSSRKNTQTVRIDYRSFLAWVRITGRPSNLFIVEKHTQIYRGPATTAVISAIDWAKTAESKKSKRQQREFIPSRLENVILELLRSPCSL